MIKRTKPRAIRTKYPDDIPPEFLETHVESHGENDIIAVKQTFYDYDGKPVQLGLTGAVNDEGAGPDLISMIRLRLIDEAFDAGLTDVVPDGGEMK